MIRVDVIKMKIDTGYVSSIRTRTCKKAIRDSVETEEIKKRTHDHEEKMK